MQLRDHSKVVHKDWVFIYMLKDAEFAIFERKLEAIFEIFISIDDSSFLVLPL